MIIEKMQVLRGPNLWSIRRNKLIQMELDLGRYETLPTNKLPDFTEKLITLLPSLYSHRCSEGCEGGFIMRMTEGTWLGHVVEHVALELQSLAGMDCGFGRTRGTNRTGVYQVVYSYVEEQPGRYAGEAAVELVRSLAENIPYAIEPVIEKLSELYYREKLGPSTEAIVLEAEKRNIPCTRVDGRSTVLLGQGVNQRLICATTADSTSSIATELVQDKHEVKERLRTAYVPVPEGLVVDTRDEMLVAARELGFPLVIKPVDGNHGRGVTTGIISNSQASEAFDLASNSSNRVIVERFIQGDDYRLLVVDFKLVAAAKRSPAQVLGDGYSSIKQLIDKENMNPARGESHEKVLTRITIDKNTRALINKAGLKLDTILPFGKQLRLKDAANLSSGGTAQDVTDILHEDMAYIAERAARLMNLNICGIDLIKRSRVTLGWLTGWATQTLCSLPGATS